MKIPINFTIGETVYEVVWKWNLRDERNNFVLGLCERDYPRIYLNRTLRGDERVNVFVHEFMHAVISELRKMRSITKKDLSYETEEMVVEALANFLCEMFSMKVKRKDG